MSFVVNDLVQNSISHVETGQTVPVGQAPRGVYFETEHYDDVCWYIKNHYDDPNLFYGSSSIYITDRFGEFLDEKKLGHLVFRIKRSSASQHFLALSFTLRLYSYFPTSGNCKIRDISENIPTRYHVQCIDLSDNSEFIFYSNWNKIIRLDHNLRPLETWRIPNKLNRENKATSLAIQQALSTLGFSKYPSMEEIKSAFRKNLLRVHPDINKTDPHASDKTRAVVEAYEVLTRGTDTKDETESNKQIFQIRVPFDSDSVTATQIKAGTEDLFVGCYSGRVYLLLRNGRSNLIYNSHAPIRKIMECGRYLYVVTDHFWDILCNGILVNRIEGRFRLERILFEGYCNAVMRNRKSVRLYSPGGIAFVEVNFKDNISDVFMLNQKLKVITGKKSYVFSVQIPSDYTMLAEGDLYLPY